MNKKFPYEEPEFLLFEVLTDIVTFSNEQESEDDDWGMGFIPI